MTLFLWGACAMATVTIASFFFKFYRDTHDRLFAWFAAAFICLAVHWTGLAIARPADDMRHYFYVTRLLAFVLILVGIIDKNGPTRKRKNAAPQD